MNHLTAVSTQRHPAGFVSHQEKVWQIGVVGTFDVENYGDLLFPLVAEAELSKRLGRVNLHRFSYNDKGPSEWPYEVTSVTALPRLAGRLDGLLIGGGFLIRFDKDVATGYEPPSPSIHHPTGYWLGPALIALQQGIPLIWNAPGMHQNEIPLWAQPLVRLSFAHSRYIAVRDEPSRDALAQFAGPGRINLVPDTAFGISELIDQTPTAAFENLRQSLNLSHPYIVVQAALGLEAFQAFLKRYERQLEGFQIVAFPVSPILGDDAALVKNDSPRLVRLTEFPHPLLAAELISNAEAVVGHSYHLTITALAAGVPVFNPQDFTAGKYSALSGFENIFPLPAERDVEWFMARVGRSAPKNKARAVLNELDEHWNRVASALCAGPAAPAEAINQFWQVLPRLLEQADDPVKGQTEGTEKQQLRELLSVARADVIARDNRISALCTSRSWRLTAPLRKIGDLFRNNPPIIDLSRIRLHRLETKPFAWARIDQLFSPADAQALVASFPRDHFKTVSGYGGEKDYEYAARSLIGMGAQSISRSRWLSKIWRRLAHELLSPGYRAALMELTGCDLRTALLEANIFHYGTGCSLGPHVDLPDKILTHVLYFNRTWNIESGGCLAILGSANPDDCIAEVAPNVGGSAVLVRSEKSWHAVSRVIDNTGTSRCSLTATFFRAGSLSSMWPRDDRTLLNNYPDSTPDSATKSSLRG